MTPKISVIMGIYNCASTLQEALDSLYAQTCQDFKLIMCDDCSTDNTYEVARQYAEMKDNIVLIRNERNRKLAATLNHCLEYVDTEYVARMDGDDISEPTRFERELSFLESHPEYDIVSTAMTFFDESGDYGRNYPKEVPVAADFKKGTPFCHAPCMVRTKAYRAVNGYTASSRVERVEDYYLWYKMFKAGFKGYNISEPLYKMRNDRAAFARRKVRDRFRGYKVELEVLRGLRIPYARFYALLHLGKVLVPVRIQRFIKKMR